MYKKSARLGAVIASIIAVALLMLTIQPISSASALGLTVRLAWNRVQVGESLVVTPNDACPAAASNTSPYIYASIQDPVSHTPIGGEYGLSPYGSPNGSWFQGLVQVWNSPGTYDLVVSCKQGNTVTQTYDAVPFTIVANDTTSIAVDKTQYHSESNFHSTVPCPTASTVEISLYGRQTGGATSMSFWGTYIHDYVNTDASGNWSYSVEFTEQFPERWGSFFIRADCTTGSLFSYDSRKINLTEAQYVALGDSYSAGTGTFNPDLDIPFPYGIECLASSNNYAYYIANNSATDYDTPDVQACNGATTSSVLWGDVVPQFETAGPNTELITLTVGGNDAGFKSILTRCANWAYGFSFGCSTDSSLTLALSQRISAFAGFSDTVRYEPENGNRIYPLPEVITAITNAAQNAEVYVAGYPHLFGEYVTPGYDDNLSAPSGWSCNVSTVSSIPVRIDYADAQWMNDQADLLNTVIENTVEDLAADGLKVHYVPASNFDGHGLCDTGAPWINGVSFDSFPDIDPNSFHPTGTGFSAGYGAKFVDAID